MTRNPHKPKMMLGTAASISMAVPSTRDTAGCTSSTSSRAMASASGTATIMAMRVVTNVPKRLESAPYWFALGAQSTCVSGLTPLVWMASHEFFTSTPMSTNMAMATAAAQATVNQRKSGSPHEK